MSPAGPIYGNRVTDGHGAVGARQLAAGLVVAAVLGACASSSTSRPQTRAPMGSGAPSQPTVVPRWQTVFVRGDGFAVEVPTGARHEVSVDAGTTAHRFSWADGMGCSVSVTRLAEGATAAEIVPDLVFELEAGGRAVAASGTRHHYGFVGQELEVVDAQGEHERWWVFIHAGRVYILGGPVSPSGAISAGTQRCFDSFRMAIESVPL